MRVMTGKDWADARRYHLCLDTGALGFEAAEEIIISAVRSRFGGDG